MRFTLGLDVARVRDDSALGCLEAWRAKQVLVHLAAWKPTREDCADAVLVPVDWLSRNSPDERARIAIDGRKRAGTAVVSAAVLGELGRLADVYALLPSPGTDYTQRPSDGWIYVGKDSLVELLASALETGDLLIAAGLPDGGELKRELYRLARIPTRKRTATTWSHPDQSKRSHDDRVMAVAYGYWLAHTLATRGQAVLPLGRYR